MHKSTKRLIEKNSKKGYYACTEVVVNEKQILKKKIQQTELQMKRLMLNSSQSEVSEDLYNSLVLQKAILKKELEELGKNPIVEKIKSFIPHKEKLICDYFKS